MATSLTLSQQQKLQIKLSPAQIQVMRMLELPACELQARINEELQENPALEEGIDKTQDIDIQEQDNNDEYQNPLQNEDFNYDDYVQDDDISERNYTNRSQESAREDIPFSVGMSFGEYLKSQIYLTKMDKPDRHIAKFVVGNIDENGYLRRTAEELVDDLSFREGISVTDEKMQDIIKKYTGQTSNLLRFPGGGSNTISRFNPGIMTRLTQKLNEMGYTYFDWNVDCYDTQGYNSYSIAQTTINQIKGRQSSVVLMHDIKYNTVEAIKTIVKWGLDNGYVFAVIDESTPPVQFRPAN